jgi:hypothetical protein
LADRIRQDYDDSFSPQNFFDEQELFGPKSSHWAVAEEECDKKAKCQIRN